MTTCCVTEEKQSSLWLRAWVARERTCTAAVATAAAGGLTCRAEPLRARLVGKRLRRAAGEHLQLIDRCVAHHYEQQP